MTPRALVARSSVPLVAALAIAAGLHGLALAAHGRRPSVSPRFETVATLVGLTALAFAGLWFGARAAHRLLAGARPSVSVPAVLFLCMPAMVLGAFAAWFLAAVLGAW